MRGSVSSRTKGVTVAAMDVKSRKCVKEPVLLELCRCAVVRYPVDVPEVLSTAEESERSRGSSTKEPSAVRVTERTSPGRVTLRRSGALARSGVEDVGVPYGEMSACSRVTQ